MFTDTVLDRTPEERKERAPLFDNYIKIYETNSGLGYNQLAYGIKLKDGFFVIDTQNNNSYIVGELEKYSPDLILEVSNYKVSQSPLYNTFLFQEMLETLRRLSYGDVLIERKNVMIKGETIKC